MDGRNAEQYSSNTQKIRVITEAWVNDGAYNTMIERITSFNNPNFFFMHYNKSNL